MWEQAVKTANNDNQPANQAEISLFDVKELYDAAYAAKESSRFNLKAFQVLLDKAERLDAAYRAQLTMKMEQPFSYKQAA